jgi:NADH dehydrogenase
MNIIDVARAVQVNQILYFGTQARNCGVYSRTKHQAEALFIRSGLPVTVIRPSFVYGPGSRGLFPSLVGLLRRLPFLPVLGTGSDPVCPVYVGDVADVVTKCLREPRAIGKVYSVSGSETVCMRFFLDQILRALNLERRFVYVPYPLAFSALAIAKFLGIRAPVSLDTLRGLRGGGCEDSSSVIADLGHSPTPLYEGLSRSMLDPGPMS